jgi:hypothetical protein
MERYNVFLADIRKAVEDRQRYIDLGLTQLAETFDTIIAQLTAILQGELEQNQYVQAYKQLNTRKEELEKEIAQTVEQMTQYEGIQEVQVYKSLIQTF